MKTYQINHASTATGPFGTFGNLLATPVGHSEEQPVDKIVIRTTPAVAEAIAEKLKGLKGTGKVLTATAEFQAVQFSTGELGFRKEAWEDKKTGEHREQSALYLRFATTPVWGKADGKNDLGNLSEV